MALAMQHKIDIRRHLRIPFGATASSNMTLGIRTLYTAGQLEFYMNNLSIEEECTLTGYFLGSYRLNAPPNAGDTITSTITANGNPLTNVTYTVTATDVALPNSALQTVSTNVATRILQANLGVFAQGTTGAGNPGQPLTNPNAQISLSNPTSFTLACSATGNSTVVLLMNGSAPPYPTITVTNVDGSTSTLNGYIAICNYLQVQTVTTTANLAVLSAGPDAVTMRPYELRQRVELYDYWRDQMAAALSMNKNAWGFRGNTGPGGSVV